MERAIRFLQRRQQLPAPHLAEDLDGGSELIVTDGSTTVDPTTTLEIAEGLELTDEGAGVAKVAAVGKFWFDEDCCLHWICPGSGHEFKVCGEDVTPVPMIEVAVDLSWSNWGTAWITVAGTLPSVISEVSDPFDLDGTSTQLDCNTAGSYDIVFDGTLTHAGDTMTTDIYLLDDAAVEVYRVVDAESLSDGHDEPIHVETSHTFISGGSLYFLVRHQTFTDDPDLTTLQGTLTLTLTP